MDMSTVQESDEYLRVHDVLVKNRLCLTSFSLQVYLGRQRLDTSCVIALGSVRERVCFKRVLNVWQGALVKQKLAHWTVALQTSIVQKGAPLHIHDVDETSRVGQELIHAHNNVAHLHLGEKCLLRKG